MTTFYRLLGFLRPYKRGVAASCVLACVAMVMTVALPTLTGRAVDALQSGARHAARHELALRNHDRHVLLLVALAIVGAVLLRWALTYARRMIAGRLSLGEKLWLIPGHCDPTVNLHDWYVGIRNMAGSAPFVDAVWPISARGAIF